MQDALDHRLLNDFQRGFPLVERPFAAIGARVGAHEDEVLERYRRLARAGAVSRIGVVFRPHAAGASLLAALALPPARVAAFARWMDALPEVNHSYEREHRFNLWFVLAAPSATALEAACGRIEQRAGRHLLRLPLLEEYHIDLGFDLASGARAPRADSGRRSARVAAADRALLPALREGIPLVAQPFDAVGRAVGRSAGEVLRTAERWLQEGVARRIGVVVRHRQLGWSANAMVVWDVPDADAGRVGAALAAERCVTLCYRRPRRPPQWPYNLFCMIHGRERDTVRGQLDELRGRLGIAALPHEVLFSRRCFTQRGARYG